MATQEPESSRARPDDPPGSSQERRGRRVIMEARGENDEQRPNPDDPRAVPNGVQAQPPPIQEPQALNQPQEALNQPQGALDERPPPQPEEEDENPEQPQQETLNQVKQFASQIADQYNNLLKVFTDLKEITDFVDPSLKEDLEGDYVTVAEKFLRRMEAIAEEIQTKKRGGVLKALRNVLEQVDQKKVFMCAVGRTNMGKSKTLNVLMNNDVLPVKVKAETAAVVHIESEAEVVEPRLIVSNDHSVQGSEEIRKFLELHHRQTRTRQKERSRFTLKANVPIFKDIPLPDSLPGASKFSRILVDTPGSNEVGEEMLQSLAKESILSATALLYFMKYDDLANDTDYIPLQEGYSTDEALFTLERLTIVVTHYDKFFDCDDDDAMDVRKVKEEVVGKLRKLGLEASPDIVVPISTEWAYQGRKLLRNSGAASREKVINAWIKLHQYRNPLRGQGQSIYAEADRKSSIEAAKEINAASNFAELETRLKKVAGELQVLWSRNLLVRCRHFAASLDQDLHDLQNELLLSRDKLTSVTEAANLCQKIINMLRPVEFGNSLELLKTAYQRDIRNFYEEFVHPAYINEEEEFTQRINAVSHWMPDEWNTAVEDFKTRVQSKLTLWVRRIHYKECPLMLRKHQLNVSSRVSRLQGIAGIVTSSRIVTLTGDDAVRRIEDHDKLKQLRLQITPGQLPHIHRTYSEVSILARLADFLFEFRWQEVVRQQDIDGVRERMRTAIEESYYNLVDSDDQGNYKEKVLVHYLKKHCQEICEFLDDYEAWQTRELARDPDAIDKMKAQSKLRSKYKHWQGHIKDVAHSLEHVYKFSSLK